MAPMTIDIFDRIGQLMEKVRDRLLRSTGALEAAGIGYAVAGDAAVGAWVARIDESSVRTTKELEILLRRSDLPMATAALQAKGFVPCNSGDKNLFLDEGSTRTQDAIRVTLVGEKVHRDCPFPAPDIDAVEFEANYWMLPLDSLIHMKLSSWRLVDRVHVRDMIDVGLIDDTWLNRYPPVLTNRLKELFESPFG